ncbi:hypothetical protein ScPMuIL_013936 [Solemya velum]
MIKFLLIVNRQGQLRLRKYFEEKVVTHGEQREIIRQCLSAVDKQNFLVEFKDFTVVYKKYGNLYFIAGITSNENELAVLELMHHMVETLDKYFDRVSEIDILYSLDRVHMVIDEMVVNGYILETSQPRILVPLQLLDVARK